ncbi:major facilitator superfamily permease [Ferroplasma acidiphilum]|uniref:Major facilitator superfamily permease n=1 Tax=Ferroplasma acidiphilum TaxID=74969 RepID=A0A1V0N1A6_9ARCH|nr:MFS transporter [Ferroplasma acidiphilum]ARD83942.1 major facilitator superfamily permease [Ferroplasma acidiphilum]
MVENDAYSVLDNAKVGKFQRRLAVTAALGPFTDAFNEFGASISLIAVGILFHLPPVLVAAATAAYWVGVAAGAILGGIASDAIGRKQIFLYDTIGMAVFAVISAIATGYISYFLARLALGIFIGMDYAAAVPLLSEYSPSKKRGGLLSTEKLFFMFGTIATVVIGMAFTYYVGVLLAWRYDFLIAAIPAIILFGLRFDMPASLRWAKASGRKDLIPKILKKLHKEGIDIDPETVKVDKPQSIKENIHEFFNSKNKKTVAYIFWIGAAYALTVNLVSVYASTVLENLGATSFFAEEGTLIIDIVGTFGVILTLIVVDRIGRRLMGLFGFVLGAIPLTVLIVADVYHAMTIPLVISMFGLFFFINVGLVGTLQYLPAAEVSTTKSRGLAVGWEKLFEFGLALPALTLYAYIGLFYSFIYDAIMVIIGGIVLYFLSFETKNRSLERNAMEAEKKHTKSREGKSKTVQETKRID